MLVRAATVVEWGRATVVEALRAAGRARAAVRAAAVRAAAARTYVCSIIPLFLPLLAKLNVLSSAVENGRYWPPQA